MTSELNQEPPKYFTNEEIRSLVQAVDAPGATEEDILRAGSQLVANWQVHENAVLVVAARIKEEKAHRQLKLKNNGKSMTWEVFCPKYFGKSSNYMDRLLRYVRDLERLGLTRLEIAEGPYTEGGLRLLCGMKDTQLRQEAFDEVMALAKSQDREPTGDDFDLAAIQRQPELAAKTKRRKYPSDLVRDALETFQAIAQIGSLAEAHSLASAAVMRIDQAINAKPQPSTEPPSGSKEQPKKPSGGGTIDSTTEMLKVLSRHPAVMLTGEMLDRPIFTSIPCIEDVPAAVMILATNFFGGGIRAVRDATRRPWRWNVEARCFTERFRDPQSLSSAVETLIAQATHVEDPEHLRFTHEVVARALDSIKELSPSP